MTDKKDLLSEIGQILDGHELCDACLGRLYGGLSHGLTNEERGRSLRVSLAMARDKPPPEPEDCEICEGLFRELDEWVEEAAERVAGLEFDSFLFGNRMKEEWIAHQGRLEREFELRGSEELGHAINRELGKKFRERLREEGRKVEADFGSPDLTVLVDLRTGEISLDIRPIYVYGRYRKLSRGIPQTIWHCDHCRGAGCQKCSYTGRKYEDSVEERISSPLKRAARGESTLFHGAGREDVDVLTLGKGRPFAVEIKEPELRRLNSEEVTKEINENSSGVIEVSGLNVVTEEAVGTIKESKLDKIYRLQLRLSKPVSEETFRESLSRMEGRIFQRTPERVSHRRAKKVRVRECKPVDFTRSSPGKYRIDLWAESGLYIKELFTSEWTIPSFSQLLDSSVEVTRLDVLDIPGNLKKLPDCPGEERYTYEQTSEDVKKSLNKGN